MTPTTALDALARMSRFAGMRLDLVQAGGGNSSVKLPDGQMYIKASGFWLSEVTPQSGWSRLPHAAVAALLDAPALAQCPTKAEREAWTTAQVQALVQEGPRSSIETLLHAAIPQPFVLHTHPLLVNILACKPDWDTRLQALFPTAAMVPYDTPGLELTLAMRTALQATGARTGQLPQLFFLQNHGLIVAADTEADIYALHHTVLDTLEAHLGTNTAAFRRSTAVADALNAATSRQDIAMLCTDEVVQQAARSHTQLFQDAPFCPDAYVFCGATALLLHDLSDRDAIANFVTNHLLPPKVVLHAGHVYCMGAHLRKCMEVADVLRFVVRVRQHTGADYVAISPEEMAYLGGWEAEKFRQQR